MLPDWFSGTITLELPVMFKDIDWSTIKVEIVSLLLLTQSFSLIELQSERTYIHTPFSSTSEHPYLKCGNEYLTAKPWDMTNELYANMYAPTTAQRAFMF